MITHLHSASKPNTPSGGRGWAPTVTEGQRPGATGGYPPTGTGADQGDGRGRNGHGSNLVARITPPCACAPRAFTTSQEEDLDRLGPLRSPRYRVST